VFDRFTELTRDRLGAAVAVHGDLGVDLPAFVGRLRLIAERHLKSGLTDDKLVTLIMSLHTNDLFLALACARGQDAGWRRFDLLYRKYLADLTHHLLARAPDLDGLGEALWIDLFLPDRSGQSRIASYDGRSSLATWLRVVVNHRIINERQRKRCRLSNLDGIPEPADPTALLKVEARLCRDRYDSMILHCFEHASRQLSAHERLIVLLRYDQDLPLGDIARLFSVHQSTITRQIDRAVRRLRRDVRALLASEFGLDVDEIEECLGVASDAFSNSLSILTFIRNDSTHDGQTAA
jgi:RNA polymerase sigma-70 factor (ECF subfamily)